MYLHDYIYTFYGLTYVETIYFSAINFKTT